jgi:hypothetical protein
MQQLTAIAKKQRENDAIIRKASQFPSIIDILNYISEFLGAHHSYPRRASDLYYESDDDSDRDLEVPIRSSFLDSKLQLAMTMLEEAANLHHHEDAMYTLADINFVSLPTTATLSTRLYIWLIMNCNISSMQNTIFRAIILRLSNIIQNSHRAPVMRPLSISWDSCMPRDLAMW